MSDATKGALIYAQMRVVEGFPEAVFDDPQPKEDNYEVRFWVNEDEAGDDKTAGVIVIPLLGEEP